MREEKREEKRKNEKRKRKKRIFPKNRHLKLHQHNEQQAFVVDFDCPSLSFGLL